MSVNANCSDSHYEPTADNTARINDGDFVLIDIWGRLENPGSVYYDITWTGVVGREPSEREQLVFETVRNARDAAIAAVEQAFAQNRPIRGFEADDAARAVIAPPVSATTLPTAPATTSPKKSMVQVRILTISKPTTSGFSCPTLASPLSPAFTCPSSACAARST